MAPHRTRTQTDTLKDGGNISWQTEAVPYLTFIRLNTESKLFPVHHRDKQGHDNIFQYICLLADKVQMMDSKTFSIIKDFYSQ